MAKNSVTQVSGRIQSSQVRRRWQAEFRQRMHQNPLLEWRCIGVDIGKYEHVVVAFDGHGALMDEPIRFGTQRSQKVQERTSPGLSVMAFRGVSLQQRMSWPCGWN